MFCYIFAFHIALLATYLYLFFSKGCYLLSCRNRYIQNLGPTNTITKFCKCIPLQQFSLEDKLDKKHSTQYIQNQVSYTGRCDEMG